MTQKRPTDNEEPARRKKVKVSPDDPVDGGATSDASGNVAPEKSKEERKAEKRARKAEKKAAREADGDKAGDDGEVVSTERVEKKKSHKDKKNKKRAPVEGAESGITTTTTPAATVEISTSPNTSAATDSQSGAYSQTASLSAVPATEVEAYLKEHNISIQDPRNSTASLRPILNFTQLPSTDLLAKGPFADFTQPTPIQAASWPHSLSGRDIIGIAETGSGKTLAFSVPCVEALHRLKRPSGTKKSTARPRAVIVSPTRELAMQTHATISALGALVGQSAVCLYGGASKDEQRRLLHQNAGADIVVATPGRLKDFLSEGALSLEKAAFVVLDEADRMLDKGFEDDIKAIIGQCPAKQGRQTLMFTATWPSSVRNLAESFMIDPVKVIIARPGTNADDGAEGGGGGVELQANIRITQKVEVLDPREKEQRLLYLLKQAQKGKGAKDRILVFCLYKKETTRVENFLQSRGIQVAAIHGDLRQEQRTRSLEAFKSGTTTVLLATDVAARGLDIPEVKLVINLTFPLTIEDYVHRIGRTGRAGKTGEAITLFTEHDKALSGSLINILKAANQEVPEELLKFGGTVKKKAHDTYGAFFKDVDMSKKGTKITFD